jgi:uncharacterized cupredoxin-like copper-binding protein
MCSVRWLIAGFAAGAAGTTCARPAPQAAAPQVVTLIASDYAFSGPDTIPAGVTTLRMVNTGREPHQAGLIRADSGKTIADLEAAMSAPGAPPAWAVFVGGANLVVPGDTSNATQLLTPGRYVFICFIPSPDGKPHFAKGMMRPLVVKGPAPSGASEPAADNRIVLNDYGFQIARPVTAGAHVFRVENVGPQLHEVMVLVLAPGKSSADLLAWERGGMKGPAPARPIGGIVGLTPGEHATFTLTLAPGQYLLGCFVPDAKDGKAHLAHGMLQAFAVS